jgi:hypothetical protein
VLSFVKSIHLWIKKHDIVTGKEEEFPVGIAWQYGNEFPLIKEQQALGQSGYNNEKW